MGLAQCQSHPVGSIDTARAEVREWKQPWKWAWNRRRNYTRMGAQGVSSALPNASPKSGALSERQERLLPLAAASPDSAWSRPL